MRYLYDKKRLKIFLSMALIASMLCSNVAFAETQVETVTYKGKAIKCTLDCDWNLVDNDRATAKTNWYGKDGYEVKVTLYSCQDHVDTFHKIATDYGEKGAVAMGSKAGVWEFKSIHGVRNVSTKKNETVCTLTDW